MATPAALGYVSYPPPLARKRTDGSPPNPDAPEANSKPALEAVSQGNGLILKRPLEQLVREGPAQGRVARFLRDTVILHGLCGPVDYQLNAIVSMGGRLTLDDDHVFHP
jgi:hypothetical protein